MYGHAAIPATTLRASLAAALRPFTTAERALPVAVAAIVAVASLLALLPGTPAGAVGGVQGRGGEVRISVNAAAARSFGPEALGDISGPAIPHESFTPIVLPNAEAVAVAKVVSTSGSSLLDDGTLLTGYAPETTVDDGADLIVKYRVKAGDTLSGVAKKFGVTTMTLWWANKLESKAALHVGQTLRIPPVSGLVVTVKETDTLDSLAARYDVKPTRIVDINGLTDSTLVVGQVLVVPGARGAPIATPKPKPAPKVSSSHPSSAPRRVSSRSSGTARYTGGRMHWPVVGGHNYVSQGYHYGHAAIDIAADYGATVVAAAGGRVTFAGWKSNGGGWQVWISHGNGLFTTYNHMSALTVGRGQFVGRGQQVGRIGSSGWATGPHLHFEVWVGPIWSGGHQVNPMRYF
jgi:murein DD-endopeptidase MepM/ murein hydrolase activator NlpD